MRDATSMPGPRPRRTVKLIGRADRARDRKDWDTAVRLYGKALRRQPANPPIWVQYGHALKESGRLAEAEQAYRTAILGDPESADAHLQLGHALKLQGRQAEAEAAYLLSSVHDPASPEPMRELASFGWSEGTLGELKRIAQIEAAVTRSATKLPGGSPPEQAFLGAAQSAAEIDRLGCIIGDIERRVDWADAAAAYMCAEIGVVRRDVARALRRSALALAPPAE